MKSIRNIKNIFKLFRDTEVPVFKKFILIFGIAYFILPFDLIPEFPVFGIGYIDDLAVIIAVLNYLAEYLNKYNGSKKPPKNKPNEYIDNIDYSIRDE